MVKKSHNSPRTEVALSCRPTLYNHAPVRIIKSDEVVLANSINRSCVKRAVIVQCNNPTRQSLELPATIGTFTNLDRSTRCGWRWGKSTRGWKRYPRDLESSRAPRGHVQTGFQGLCYEGTGGSAGWLTHLSPDRLFSVILTQEGTRPMQQPLHRLGPQNELEAKRQV